MRALSTIVGSAIVLGAIFGGAAQTLSETTPDTPVSAPSVSVPDTSTAPSVPETVAQDRPVPTTPERTPVPVEASSVPAIVTPAPRDYIVPVDCAQEDTCRLDYRGDGTWVLIYGETYTPGEVWTTNPLPVTCPQEDDCALDYRGDLHRWVITENAPH